MVDNSVASMPSPLIDLKADCCLGRQITYCRMLHAQGPAAPIDDDEYLLKTETSSPVAILAHSAGPCSLRVAVRRAPC